MSDSELENKLKKLSGAIRRITSKLQIGSVEENRAAQEIARELEKQKVEEEKRRKMNREVEEAKKKHQQALDQEEEERKEATKLEKIQKQRLELLELKRKNVEERILKHAQIAQKAAN